jgi:hypothetical protein
MAKMVIQHITDGNELYWDEADVSDTDVKDGVYTGKPRRGSVEGLRKQHVRE